jgi:hypothetical protein
MARPFGRPDLVARDESDRARVAGAFAAMRGEKPQSPEDGPHEQAEDGLISELEQILSRANEIIGQLKQGQDEVEGRGTTGGEPDEDTGSPSAQGMP